MILEKAFVKYDKNGNYDYTVQSDYMNFENEKEAREYVEKNIEKDYEFYFFETQEDIEENNHYDVIICNDLIKEV